VPARRPAVRKQLTPVTSSAPATPWSASPAVYSNLAIAGSNSHGTTSSRNRTYLIYKFTEVFVDSMQWSGSQGGDDTPTESVSFSFGKIEWEYYPQDTKGKLGKKVGPMSWDQRENVGG
jgi:type VI secretion system secreted protein Hcp